MERLIIIGSGPAGISAALYAVRAGIKTTVISNGAGALEKTDKIENYYGFPEIISGKELHERGIAGAKRLGVEFLTDEVVSVKKSDVFYVKTPHKQLECDALILATGVSKLAPEISGLEEFEGRGVSYCAICDGFFFRGKRVAVLGTGENALSEINELKNITSDITLLTNGDEITAEFPETVSVISDEIESVDGDGKISSVNFKTGQRLSIDALFVAYKTAGSTAIAKRLGVKTDGRFILTDEEMKTNIRGLFAAGDCRGGLLQISKSVYDGAVAGTSAVKYLKAKIAEPDMV
ncbi:MAG: FAD-dependent oxidoreductase [Oscillospiraceae bacterium]|nr:FAD-dependent oxidoreductase [Oscillospiraceae bacterium]